MAGWSEAHAARRRQLRIEQRQAYMALSSAQEAAVRDVVLIRKAITTDIQELVRELCALRRNGINLPPMRVNTEKSGLFVFP